jgi:hypothetical protein
MVIGIEWGRKSVAYERLWDIAGVLGVDVVDLILPPKQESDASSPEASSHVP